MYISVSCKRRKRVETDMIRLSVKMDFREIYQAELCPGRHRFQVIRYTDFSVADRLTNDFK